MRPAPFSEYHGGRLQTFRFGYMGSSIFGFGSRCLSLPIASAGRTKSQGVLAAMGLTFTICLVGALYLAQFGDTIQDLAAWWIS